MHDDKRKDLLFPPWAAVNGKQYDELSDVDKAIWRRTRGQKTDADSMVAWVHELAIAIEAGEISRDEAEQALERMNRDEPKR